MNRKTLALLVGLGLVAAFGGMARAEELDKDEQKLEKTSGEVDKVAAEPAGQTAVTDRIKADFKVDDARVAGLREQKLGYGEISIALALAQNLPGGITDANVKTIMDLRTGPPKMGWGQIAKQQGVKLGALISKVKRVDGAARKQEKAANKGQMKKEGRGESSGRPERAEKPARAEKPERPEHSGKRQ